MIYLDLPYIIEKVTKYCLFNDNFMLFSIFVLENLKAITDDEESSSSNASTVVPASVATTSALRRGVKDSGGGGGGTSFPSNLSSYVAGAIEVAENQV